MEILLFDEMRVPDVERFRALFKHQLEPGVGEANTFRLPNLEVKTKEKKWWREATMYPSLLTVQGVGAAQRLNEFKNHTDEDITAVLMRERFALGFFMVKPTADLELLEKMRQDIAEYCKQPGMVALYHKLYLIVEPNKSMGESLVFQAANPDNGDLDRKLPVETPESDSSTPESMVVIPRDSWPFLNFGCHEVDAVAEDLPQDIKSIYTEDVRLYGGRWLDVLECGKCKQQDTLYFCSFHQVLLCKPCFNHGLCHTMLRSVWQVDDLSAGILDHVQTVENRAAVACMQLLGPNQDCLNELIKTWGVEDQAAFQRETRGRKAKQNTELEVAPKVPNLPCQELGTLCTKNAKSLCSACSHLVCESCTSTHTDKVCNLLSFDQLKEVWYKLLSNFDGLDSTLSTLVVVGPGHKIATRTQVASSNLSEIIRNEIVLLHSFSFPVGCDFLRKTYLRTFSKPKIVSPVLTLPVLTPEEVRMRKARRLMREWEIAKPEDQRHAVYKAVKVFLNELPDLAGLAECGEAELPHGEEVKEEPVELTKKARRLACLKAEFDYFSKICLENQSEWKLERKKWQSVLSDQVIGMHPDRAAKLVWLDPYCRPKHQPQMEERATMRALLDDISTDGTVVLVFGRFLVLGEYWNPIFADGLGKSNVKWVVDGNAFTVHRSSSRARPSQNFTKWHSMNECILTAVRHPGTRQNPGAAPGVLHYTSDFKDKYGARNGVPINSYHDYEPPIGRTRLKDQNGKDLRIRAEKTPALCEYFLDLITDPGDLVVDLFAGTASMGLACIKSNRRYYGSDKDENVVKLAKLRLARLMLLRERGDFSESLKKAAIGLNLAVSEQVSGGFLLPENNIPKESVGRQPLSENPEANFGLFLEGEDLNHNLVVKETELNGAGGQPVGKGVFTTVERHEGEKLPLIVWGKIMPYEDYRAQLDKKSVPDVKGCFELNRPFAGMALVLDERCPARYVNDARGIQSAEVNVEIIQRKDPRALFNDEQRGLHLFLWAKASKNIPAGSQLFIDYGNKYWVDDAGIGIGRTEDPPPEEELPDEEEEEEEERKREEEKRQQEDAALALTKKKKKSQRAVKRRVEMEALKKRRTTQETVDQGDSPTNSDEDVDESKLDEFLQPTAPDEDCQILETPRKTIDMPQYPIDDEDIPVFSPKSKGKMAMLQYPMDDEDTPVFENFKRKTKRPKKVMDDDDELEQ